MQDITEDDFEKIEEYSSRLPNIIRGIVQLEKCSNKDEEVQRLLEHFFGIYSTCVEFKFPPGDKKLLMLIVRTIKTKMLENVSFFDLDSNYINCSNVEPTLLGDLYSNTSTVSDVKRNLQKKNTNMNQPEAIRSELIRETNYDNNSIEELTELLKVCLQKKLQNQKSEIMSEKAGENTSSLKQEVIEVDFGSVLSLLMHAGIIALDSRNPNGPMKTASGKIKCFCSTPVSVIKVYFVLRSTTSNVITLVLKAKQASTPISADELLLIESHFTSCWSLSNLISHNKSIHIKNNELNGE